jgi:hypothetical protein
VALAPSATAAAVQPVIANPRRLIALIPSGRRPGTWIGDELLYLRLDEHVLYLVLNGPWDMTKRSAIGG